MVQNATFVGTGFASRRNMRIQPVFSSIGGGDSAEPDQFVFFIEWARGTAGAVAAHQSAL
jgi:hypothetical protein